MHPAGSTFNVVVRNEQTQRIITNLKIDRRRESALYP